MPPAATAEDDDRNTGPGTGRNADSPWQMPFAGWKQVAVRTWKQSSEDNVALVAAGVAFYGFLALVPLLGATVLTYGIVADPQTVLANVKSLTSVMPAEAATLVGDQLMSVVQASSGKKGIGLAVALGVALFGARNAAGSIITALNIAYEEEEKRGFLRVNILSLLITLAAVVLSVLALLAITAVGYLESLVPNLAGLLVAIGKVLSYILLLFGAPAGAATLYRYAPDRKQAKWVWITPGTLFAALLWLLLTFGFGYYVAHFGNYNKTYGSLATVVILVTWMYLSAYVFLFGAELNSELEHQTARDTTTGPPKPLGERGAWPADRVAGSEEPSKPSGGDVSPPHGDEQPHGQVPATPQRSPAERNSAIDDYVTGRIANRTGWLVGLRSVGTVSAVLSTIGLSLLRKRGKASAGVALVGTAVGISLLRRKD